MKIKDNLKLSIIWRQKRIYIEWERKGLFSSKIDAKKKFFYDNATT